MEIAFEGPASLYCVPIDCHINFDANRDPDNDFVVLDSRSFLWVRAVDVGDEGEVRSGCGADVGRFQNDGEVDALPGWQWVPDITHQDVEARLLRLCTRADDGEILRPPE